MTASEISLAKSSSVPVKLSGEYSKTNSVDRWSDANRLISSAPRPAYPDEAKKEHASGQVQVKVLIDETGKVISAEAVFGPESLRKAAVEAARRARFSPARVDGVPAKLSGIITYDFVAR